MSVNSISRYVAATIETVTDDRGTHLSMSVPFPTVKVFNFTYYQWRSFDTVDSIAYQTLGNGRLWWLIAEANPEILDWQTLPTGTIIRLPSV